MLTAAVMLGDVDIRRGDPSPYTYEQYTGMGNLVAWPFSVSQSGPTCAGPLEDSAVAPSNHNEKCLPLPAAAPAWYLLDASFGYQQDPNQVAQWSGAPVIYNLYQPPLDPPQSWTQVYWLYLSERNTIFPLRSLANRDCAVAYSKHPSSH